MKISDQHPDVREALKLLRRHGVVHHWTHEADEPVLAVSFIASRPAAPKLVRQVDPAQDAAFTKFWDRYPNVQGRKRNRDRVRAQFLKVLQTHPARLRQGTAWWFAHWAIPANTPYVPAPEVFFSKRWWDIDVDDIVHPTEADANPFATFLKQQNQPKEIES